VFLFRNKCVGGRKGAQYLFENGKVSYIARRKKWTNFSLRKMHQTRSSLDLELEAIECRREDKGPYCNLAPFLSIALEREDG